MTPLRARRGPLWLTDLVIALVAVALDLALFTPMSDATGQVGWAGTGNPPAVVLAAGLVAVPLLWWRRRAPVAVSLALSGHGAIVTALLGSRPLVAPLVGLYTAAVCAQRRVAWGCLAAVLAAHAVAVAYEASFTGPTPSPWAVLAVALVYVLLDVATWSAGRWGASAAARARARELEASRAELAAEAVAAERLRIARELHDIVAHAITVMVLQSAGAHRLAVSDPDRAAEAMRAVEDVGKQAVAELRRLLGVLRVGADATEPGPGAVSEATLSARIEGVARQLERGGIRVRTRVLGDPGRLDPSVEQTVFRVVQEGLTNVAKHLGAGSSAEVSLRWTAERLLVEVVSEASSSPAPSERQPGGYGLVGLAERVSLVGGSLHAGAEPGHGYRLRASLPTRTPQASASPPPPSVAEAAGPAPDGGPPPAEPVPRGRAGTMP